MKLTIESTSHLVTIKTESGQEIPARIWEGQTESGIPVRCFVTRVMVAEAGVDHSQFERELQEHRPPSRETLAIPLRLIL